MKTSKNKAINGIAWSTIERFSVQGVQFIVSIILARLLTPTDFGLVAIVVVFSTIFQTINESGFNLALIHKLDRDDVDYSTVFYSNIAIGVISYLLLFFIAPFLADFYGAESFTMVMRIQSLTLIVNAFGLVQTAKYTINVDFKTLARASLIAAIVSGMIGIIFAYIYHNVYAIVLQSLLYSLVYVFLMWAYSKWRPKIVFSTKRFKGLFDYAYKLIFARLISVVFEDIYSLAIGKLYTPSVLGLYNRASAFTNISSRNIIGSVQRVSTPMLCQAQKSNVDMQAVLLRFISSTALIVYPILAGLMVLAEPLVQVILGSKWSGASIFIYFTCPIGFFYLISTFNRNVFNATGRTGWALKAEIIKKMIFVGVFLLTMRFQIEILLIGLIAISIIEMIVDTYFTYRQIGTTLLFQLKSLLPIILSSLIMAVVVGFTESLFSNNLAKLFVGSIVGLVVYLLICYFFNICGIKDQININNKIC